MINHTFHKLTGAALFVALSAIISNPAKAETDPNSTLISQLRGHNTYLKEEQLVLSDYEIGRVRGAAGGILSVEFLEPVTVGDRTIRRTQVVGVALPGDDVIFKVEDDKLVFVSAAKPTWISRLNIKDEGAGSNSNNRAQLLRELESSRAVGLPPLAPETRTFVAEPEPVPAPAVEEAPIRGLW